MATRTKEVRYIVQYMMANGCVKESDLAERLAKFGQNDINESQILHSANRALKPFNMMIRGILDEITTKRYYVYICTVDNDITQAAVQYTPKQYEFFKLILQSIVHEPRGITDDSTLKTLAERVAISTTGKTRGTIPEYKGLFNEWCQKNWFVIVSEGDCDYITLGVRSMAELDVFIKKKLIEKPDELDCKGCNTISIYSVLCPDCDARFHQRCSKMYIDRENGFCKVCRNNRPMEQ